MLITYASGGRRGTVMQFIELKSLPARFCELKVTSITPTSDCLLLLADGCL